MNREVLKILEETKAIQKGHFLLSSGRHSDTYVQCAKVLMHPDMARRALSKVVEELKELEFDILLGPAMGGIIVAYEIGRQLNKPAIFSERVDNIMELRRGFEIEKGMKVVICEDVVTTAKSSYEVKELIEKHGGELVAVACILDRSPGNTGLKILSSSRFIIETYDKNDCSICKIMGEDTLVKPGSRKMS